MIHTVSSNRSTRKYKGFNPSATEIILGTVVGFIAFVALMTLKNYLTFLIFH